MSAPVLRRSQPKQHMKPQQPQPWRFNPGKVAVPWSQLCKEGKKINDEFKLDFFPPEIQPDGQVSAKIPKSEIESNVGRWCNTLVGYVVGDMPFYIHFKACVQRIWKPSCTPEIHSRENGCFFFKFSDPDECDRVLQSGPWLFDGRLIVLKKWSEKCGLGRDLLSSIPIWVRFPTLHLKLWSKSILSRIVSVLGLPLKMDRAIAKAERLSYGRFFVEVSAAKPLPSSISLSIEDGEQLEVEVDYEWISPCCRKCNSFGHTIDLCPTKKKWQVRKEAGELGRTSPIQNEGGAVGSYVTANRVKGGNHGKQGECSEWRVQDQTTSPSGLPRGGDAKAVPEPHLLTKQNANGDTQDPYVTESLEAIPAGEKNQPTQLSAPVRSGAQRIMDKGMGSTSGYGNQAPQVSSNPSLIVVDML